MMVDTVPGRQDRGLLWPTIFAVAGVAILLGLGSWQWQRMVWKEGLIARITERIGAPPIALADLKTRLARGDDVEYVRVRIRGRFLSGLESHYWAPGTAGPAWHIYAPMETEAGELVIVNRGLVADADRDPARRPEQLDAVREIVGLVRKPEARGTFTPDNDVGRNIWYWRDLEGMARVMLRERAFRALPVLIDVERGAAGAAAPRTPAGGTTRLELPNNHLQYSMTWYGLALTLVGVYVALVWSRSSHVRPSTPN
ncbi:MAG: SURF1 family protein [Hyphomicrobiaceae bacterium]|nr:SURF1 family protein [Hyphomicrobiaceae bacterium]